MCPWQSSRGSSTPSAQIQHAGFSVLHMYCGSTPGPNVCRVGVASDRFGDLLQLYLYITASGGLQCSLGSVLLTAVYAEGTPSDHVDLLLVLQLSSIGVPNEEANRRTLRELLFTSPGVEDHISGVVRSALNTSITKTALVSGCAMELLILKHLHRLSSSLNRGVVRG